MQLYSEQDIVQMSITAYFILTHLIAQIVDQTVQHLRLFAGDSLSSWFPNDANIVRVY